jgi:hypothetical protein
VTVLILRSAITRRNVPIVSDSHLNVTCSLDADTKVLPWHGRTSRRFAHQAMVHVYENRWFRKDGVAFRLSVESQFEGLR